MFEDRIGFLASLGFARVPAERVIADLGALGYRAVEWTFAHFDPRARSAAGLAAVVDATRAAGMAARMSIEAVRSLLTPPGRAG